MVVSAEGIHKSYGPVTVLDGVDLQVHRGEVVAIIGPSGSGKTTLARTLNWLEKPDRGTVSVDGERVGLRADGGFAGDRDIARQRRHIGMVFQRFNLFPHKTALQNVTLAPTYLRLTDRATAQTQARELLTQVGLGPYADRSTPAFRRPATAGRDRPRAGFAAQRDAFRRTHVGSGP